MSEEENVMDMASMYVTYSFSMVEYISVSMSQRTLISSESFIPQRAIRFALLDEMSSLFSGSWQATKSTLQETYGAIMIGLGWESALAWDECWPFRVRAQRWSRSMLDTSPCTRQCEF